MTAGPEMQPPQSWTSVAPLLVDVATGRKPADLVVRNGRWVNVHSGEVIHPAALADDGVRGTASHGDIDELRS